MTDCIRCNGVGTINSYGPCSNCIGPKKYAGIGARDTPDPVLARMSAIAMRLAMSGWILRSGRAKGADSAFEGGCDVVAPGAKVIRTATQFQPALDHAAQFHPAWDKCDESARGLHARNSLVILGDWLDDPVKFVVCWTPNGEVTGGTGQALRVAAAYSIPIFNLATVDESVIWSAIT